MQKFCKNYVRPNFCVNNQKKIYLMINFFRLFCKNVIHFLYHFFVWVALTPKHVGTSLLNRSVLVKRALHTNLYNHFSSNATHRFSRCNAPTANETNDTPQTFQCVLITKLQKINHFKPISMPFMLINIYHTNYRDSKKESSRPTC